MSANGLAFHPQPADVREDVKRAFRFQTGDPVDCVQPVDDQIAPGPECCEHRADVVLRTGQGFEPSPLHGHRGAGVAVDHQIGDHLREIGWHRAVAKPPTGHGIGFRESIKNDRPFSHTGHRRDRNMLAFVENLAIDLVGQNGQVVFDRQFRDRARSPRGSAHHRSGLRGC